MSLKLSNFLTALNHLCDRQITNSSEYGAEFGSFSDNKLDKIIVKGVVVTPYVTLRALHFMSEKKVNLAVSVLSLPLFGSQLPLSEKNFELLRSLVLNDIRTVTLSKNWVYSIDDGISYFLKTLGFKKIEKIDITLPSSQSFTAITIPEVNFEDFLSSLNHLTNNWFALQNSPKNSDFTFIFSENDLSLIDLQSLKKEGVESILGFAYNSEKARFLKQYKLNRLILPFIDFLNIALRKFSQVLQLEIGESVYFYSQESEHLLNTKSMKDKTF